jgi:hypothetical protein
MNLSELKKLLINSLNKDNDPQKINEILMGQGLSYDFSPNFTEKVLNRIFAPKSERLKELEFLRYLNFAFSRIFLTGVAAIVALLLSIFLMEGSISFNSILGMGDTYDEGIVYLLTGN